MNEFPIDYSVHRNCIVILSTSLVSVSLCALSVFFYFHHRCRIYLRSFFNHMMIGAIIAQLLESTSQIVASVLLLSGYMSRQSCNVLGAMNLLFPNISIVFITGFFYSLMALKVHPIRAFIERFLFCFCCCSADSFRIADRAAKWFWFLLALVWGIAATTGTMYLIEQDESEKSLSNSLFSYRLGFCSLHALVIDEVSILAYDAAVWVMSFFTVCSLLVLLSYTYRVRVSMYIWGRFFPIALYFAAFQLVIKFGNPSSHPAAEIATTVLIGLIGSMESICLLATEDAWRLVSLTGGYRLSIAEDGEVETLEKGVEAPTGFTAMVRAMLSLEVEGQAPLMTYGTERIFKSQEDLLLSGTTRRSVKLQSF